LADDANANDRNYRRLTGAVIEGCVNKKKTTMQTASAAARPPARRSRLRLALLALTPLALAGGGFAGWTVYAARAEHEPEPEPDATVVAAIPPEVAAESSFTHSFALSVLVAPKCGVARVPALMAASEEEARADGNLVNLSWLAAARRAAATTAISCDYLRAEVRQAEHRAVKLAQEKGEAPQAEH
jgi:hypothetical protein